MPWKPPPPEVRSRCAHPSPGRGNTFAHRLLLPMESPAWVFLFGRMCGDANCSLVRDDCKHSVACPPPSPSPSCSPCPTPLLDGGGGLECNSPSKTERLHSVAARGITSTLSTLVVFLPCMVHWWCKREKRGTSITSLRERDGGGGVQVGVGVRTLTCHGPVYVHSSRILGHLSEACASRARASSSYLLQSCHLCICLTSVPLKGWCEVVKVCCWIPWGEEHLGYHSSLAW